MGVLGLVSGDQGVLGIGVSWDLVVLRCGCARIRRLWIRCVLGFGCSAIWISEEVGVLGSGVLGSERPGIRRVLGFGVSWDLGVLGFGCLGTGCPGMCPIGRPGSSVSWDWVSWYSV